MITIIILDNLLDQIHSTQGLDNGKMIKSLNGNI